MKFEKKKILSALLLLIFGAAVSFAGFYAGNDNGKTAGLPGDISDHLDLSRPSAAETVKHTDESGETQVDFDLLTAQNPDIYAWITVPGTEIDYPVLQKGDTEDPYDNFYLDHQANLSEGLPGAIYSQPVNQKDFSDPVTILYGHNLKNGGMFSGLHAFEDKDFFDKNRQVILYTQGQILTYEIFAAADFSDALLPYEYDFTQASEVQRYLADLFACEGNFQTETDLSGNAKLLTLSTCYSGREDHRLLIGAVLTDGKTAE